MNKNIITLLIMMLCVINLINAQNQISEWCGMNAALEQIYNDPVLLKQIENKKNQLSDTGSEFNRTDCAQGVVNIPLAFHFNGDFDCGDSACILTEIQDVISTLNINFGDNTGSVEATYCPSAYTEPILNPKPGQLGPSIISTGACVKFYLAAPPACSGLDPDCDGAITIGEFDGGYNGGGNGAGNCWDDYLNVFIQGSSGTHTGVADQIGVLLPPGGNGPGEGVTVHAAVFGGAGDSCEPFDSIWPFPSGWVLTHEIGHYLGLSHLNGDAYDPNQIGGCNYDDGFADTPNQHIAATGTCATGCFPGGCGFPQQTANFMSFAFGACMDLFTQDQADAMYNHANLFFGNLNIPEANPAELYTECTGAACEDCADVNLSIFFDQIPGQTSWDITDVNGIVVVASGGPYANQSPQSTLNINPAVCLNDGCYTLNFYDSLGNGLCPFQASGIISAGTFITPGTLVTPGTIVGTLTLVTSPVLCGNYNLTDANGNSLASGGGNFGAQESNQFCLVNGLSPRLGIKNKQDTKVDILPNPASDFMTIHHNMNTDVDIKIVDLSGKTVLTNFTNQMGLSTYQVDVSNLNAGVYMIFLESAENTVVEKFIKE